MKKRVLKKQRGTIKASLKPVEHKLESIKQTADETGRVLEKYSETQDLFYTEYRELKAHSEKRYLNGIIRMRDNTLRDLEYLNSIAKQEDSVHLAIQYLGYRLQEMETFLEDNGVEIITAKPGDVFDPALHKVIAVEVTDREEENEKIAKVYTEGYVYMDKVLKKINVRVSRYEKESNGDER